MACVRATLGCAVVGRYTRRREGGAIVRSLLQRALAISALLQARSVDRMDDTFLSPFCIFTADWQKPNQSFSLVGTGSCTCVAKLPTSWSADYSLLVLNGDCEAEHDSRGTDIRSNGCSGVVAAFYITHGLRPVCMSCWN